MGRIWPDDLRLYVVLGALKRILRNAATAHYEEQFCVTQSFIEMLMTLP